MLGSIVHQRTSRLLEDQTLIQKEIRFRIHILQWCIISVDSSYHYRINPTCIFIISDNIQFIRKNRGRRGSMVVFFTTTRAISAYYHYSYEFMGGCTLCKVCQWLATCWWFSLGTPFSSTNKTDRHDIAEGALKIITPTIGKIIKITVCCIILSKHVSTHQ